MANKKAQPTIEIKGSVLGIGNVIGNHSSSHVEIKINLFSQNKIVLGERATELQRNPNFAANITRAFAPHPDDAFPELNHLIGHQAEMNRLLELYDFAARENKGAFVFITAQHGYGAKSLGRAFVDAVRQGKGRAALTRFWEQNNESHTRQDARWSMGFQRWQEILEFAPQFLKEESMFPFWGLFFQLCEKFPWLENTPLPLRVNDLPSYFRNCTQSGEPLVLLLEDFEFASSDWYKTIHYLAKEINHGLPILWIITAHSDRPLNQIPENELTPAQILAIEFAQNTIAEIYHLSRVTQQEIETYIAPAQDGVAERLHRMTDGVPLLVQNLWQDWRRTEAVFKNNANHWEMNKESRWMEYGSGRDYVRDMLEQLWVEDKAPWSVDRMYDMLALAAQEGTTFTVEALARAFNVEAEILSSELEYLLDEPDDPGLLKEAVPIRLQLQSADWQKTLERYTFSPLLVWFTLTTYEKPEDSNLIRYAEGLRDAAHPFAERFANTLAHMYEKANQPELAKKYRSLISGEYGLRKLMSEAELLLEFPENEIVYSRLYDIARQIYHSITFSNYPNWVIKFASRLLEIFESLQMKSFLDIPLLLLSYINLSTGEYRSARLYYEKMLTIEEELGRKSGIASALSGLGDVAGYLSEYQVARGYYDKALTIEKDLGCKSGVAHALYGLGKVAHSQNEYQTARGYYEKMLSIETELGHKDKIAHALEGLGEVAHALGEYQVARDYYDNALAINEDLESKSG